LQHNKSKEEIEKLKNQNKILIDEKNENEQKMIKIQKEFQEILKKANEKILLLSNKLKEKDNIIFQFDIELENIMNNKEKKIQYGTDNFEQINLKLNKLNITDNIISKIRQFLNKEKDKINNLEKNYKVNNIIYNYIEFKN
jgi:hypothetical protein